MRILVCFVPVSEFDECPIRQRHISVLAAFALLDVNDHSTTVDIAHFERSSFAKPQAAGIDSQQADPVYWEADAFEDALDFQTCEDNRQPLFRFGPYQIKGCPLPFEGLGKEKLDSTD